MWWLALIVVAIIIVVWMMWPMWSAGEGFTAAEVARDRAAVAKQLVGLWTLDGKVFNVTAQMAQNTILVGFNPIGGSRAEQVRLHFISEGVYGVSVGGDTPSAFERFLIRRDSSSFIIVRVGGGTKYMQRNTGGIFRLFTGFKTPMVGK